MFDSNCKSTNTSGIQRPGESSCSFQAESCSGRFLVGQTASLFRVEQAASLFKEFSGLQ